MQDQNVVITVREGGYKYKQIGTLLGEFGPISRTEYFNVLSMRTHSIPNLMESLRARWKEDPQLSSMLARVIPATHTFNFSTPEEFEARALEIVLSWAPELGGKGFYVRIHRRGFKGRISSWEEERRLDEALLEELEKSGASGHISFEQPEAVIAIETLGQWAGLSLWTKEDLERYPFLRFETSTKAEAKETIDGE